MNNSTFTEELIKNIFIETHKRFQDMGNLDSLSFVKFPNQLHNKYGLILPPNQKKDEQRNSEQEVKQLCIEIAKEKELTYSVETPTYYNYQFGNDIGGFTVDLPRGTKGINARVDLTLYELGNNDEKYKVNNQLNIEFKSGVVEPKNIAKDILKLLSEDADGVYFHSLISCNNGSLTTNNKAKGLFTKFADFRDIIFEKAKVEKNNDKALYIFVSCKNPNFLLYKKIKKSDFKQENFFDLEYKIDQNSIILTKPNNWINLKD